MEAKKTKHGDRDRLMELPEAILHHIFSYLPMKDVIRTSVLAKRFKYMWLYVPCLNFIPTEKTAERELAFINRSLLLHKALEIHKLSISLGTNNSQEADDYIIESWVLFAATRKVKELQLIFSGHYPVVLPQHVFKCGSLTVLKLRNCTIKTPADFRLSSLKSLSLENISRGWEHAAALLAASPNVESLSLIRCHRSYGEKIDQFIMNSSLKTLNLDEPEWLYRNQTMEVHAPFVIIFDLSASIYKEKFVFLTRMKSLESVTLEYGWGVGTVKIVDNICHVKDLTLSSSNIKAISSIEEKMNGSLSLNCTYLKLKTKLTEAELAAIVSILKLSPNIRTLIISIEEIGMKAARIPGEVDKILQKADMLKNVETVKVNDLMKNLSLRTRGKHCTTEELASQLEDDLSFLKFLIQNSPALKSMTIGLNKPLKLGQIKMMQLQLLIHEQLQAFPRASRDAVVSFTGN